MLIYSLQRKKASVWNRQAVQVLKQWTEDGANAVHPNPEISNKNMADAGTCEVKATLATLNVG
jgi:hypothetical protein